MLEYPNKLDIIFDKLKKYGIKPIFVGGFVRDHFLHINSKDIDIELYGTDSFEKVQDILEEFGNSNIIGKNFGVIKLQVDDLELDFSLPRLDNKVSSGHTGFKITTFKDLDFKTASRRRDFTINAIGYDVFDKKFLDFYDGLQDLKDKKLKYIEKKSFKEDPLRILRAVQFCARFEFRMDDDLFSTCRAMVEAKELDELPRERIYEEIRKLLLKSNKPSIGLELLHDLDINLFEIDEKKLNSIDFFVSFSSTNKKINLSIMLAILYNNSAFKLDKLTDSKSLKNQITNLLHVGKYFQNKSSTISYSTANDIDLDMLGLYLKALHVEFKSLDFIKPKTHGKDLIALGFKPSKEFSLKLQTIYEEQLVNISDKKS